MKKEIDKFNVDYVLITEKYRPMNGFICHENMNYLYNDFAQSYINADPRQNKYKTKKIWDYKKLDNFELVKEIKPSLWESKFGKIYLLKRR